MQTILRPFKFAVAFPFYVVAFLGALLVLIAARVIDAVYPDRKASMMYMRGLLGYNSSDVDIDGAPKPVKTLGLRIYR